MIRRLLSFLCLMGVVSMPTPASACSIRFEPPLEGESDEAYRVRIEQLEKVQAEQYAKQRQTDALENAKLIFIARKTEWTPPPPKARKKLRPGEPPRPIALPNFEFPMPSYFKPIAWFRGGEITDLFQIRAYNTSCGVIGFGDTTASLPGETFLFFARKSPLSQDTLIDAIAMDKIDNPALVEFVDRHRNSKEAQPILPPEN